MRRSLGGGGKRISGLRAACALKGYCSELLCYLLRLSPMPDATSFIVTRYYFSSRLEDALARNRQRTGKQRIPDRGVAGTYKRLELPGLDEGFDRLCYVRIAENGQFMVEEWKDEFR